MRLLIFAWEYDGYHSDRGAALARRVKQVAAAFNSNGWEVIVVHKDQRNECGADPFVVKMEQGGIKRIVVKLERNIEDFNKIVLLRKLETLYYITFFGDRSYYWAEEVISQFDKFGIAGKPDYILSFYTPRVTLYLGKHFSAKLNVPWVADLQDPIYQGISSISKIFCKAWVKNVLRTAKSVVHVSPEWTEEDGKEIDRKIYTIRHAIPEEKPKIESPFEGEFRKKYGNDFNVFYGGSISPRIQSLDLLKRVVDYAHSRNITVNVFVAGNQSAYDLFRDALTDKVAIHAGWLTPLQMNEYIYSCHCTLVIPWSMNRVGIPSKFYELCSFRKPIWIIGNDIGGFKSLISEWKHPEIGIGDFEYQKKAFDEAVQNGNFSYMFNIDKCKGTPVTIGNLYEQYKQLF